MPKYTPEQRISAFWSKVDKSAGEDACWNWTIGFIWNGYGHVSWLKSVQLSHRIAWKLTYGDIPAGLHVLHTCDNRKCCNPKHLFLGTNQDNIDDKVRKGRAHGGAGIRNNHAKLNDDLVRRIRQRYAQGGVTQTQLEKEFGIAQTSISLIVRRKAWKHVRD